MITPEYITAMQEGIEENMVSNYLFDVAKDTKNKRSYFTEDKTIQVEFPITSQRIEKLVGDKLYWIGLEINGKNSEVYIQTIIHYRESEYYKSIKDLPIRSTVRKAIAMLIWPNDSFKGSWNVKCEVMQLFMEGKIDWEQCVKIHHEGCKL